MNRPVVFDLTHLVKRAIADAPTGIDRVDLAFGRHFGLHSKSLVGVTHYGRRSPILLPVSELIRAVEVLEDKWREEIPAEEDAAFVRAKTWLTGIRPEKASSTTSGTKSSPHRARKPVEKPRESFLSTLWRRPASIPEGAIYLNIAQHALERRGGFDWMAQRPDLQRVFFVHDLLPLDHPEFWWGGHEKIFEDRVRVIAQHATAVITSTEAVRERVIREMTKRGRPDVPVFACHLPSPIESSDPSSGFDAELAEHPYFVVTGTLEPRKNHMLLFNLWRHMANRGDRVPKLVLIGKRGWESEQTIDMLERCRPVRDHALELSGASNAGMRRLIANACGLLMPSFAEGYGLPLVEALSLRTPVIASDIPVFREVTQNKAIFRDPIDGQGWRAAIMDLMDRTSGAARAAKAAAASYEAPRAAGYFEAIEAFLASL